MNEIFLEPYARFFVLLHALGAIALVGALTHGSVFLHLSQKRAREGNLKRAARFWPILWTALLWTLATGSLAYPTYRIRTRADYLEGRFPLPVQLFDLKENYAAVVLALLCACWVLWKLPSESLPRTLLHNSLFHLATLLSWTAGLSGLWVVLHRGIG